MSEFEYEKDMTQPTIQALEAQGFICETELLFNAGERADILAVQFDDKKCHQRMEQGPITPLGAKRNCSKAILEAPDWWPHFQNTIAVELKLTNYQKAIKQARSYSRQVMYSYVCFPEDTLESEERLDTIYQACQKTTSDWTTMGTNVGLIELTNEGNLNYLKRPEMCKYIDAIGVFWQVEKLWMKWRERHEQ